MDFQQNICGCDYYIICLVCGNNTSLHCSVLSTHSIKATRHSIEYLAGKQSNCFFVRLIGNLCYCGFDQTTQESRLKGDES